MASLALGVGQTVELNDGRHAIVRFVGATGFAPGEWVGVELDEASGKNDGSVKGERYFDCDTNHGMFLRAAGVSSIVSLPPVTRPTSINLPPPPALDTAKAASALPSPIKSPTKLIRTATPSATQPTRNPTPPAAATPAARRPLVAATAKPRTASNLTAASTLSAAARRSSTVPSSNPTATAQTPRNPASSAAPASSRLTARTTSTAARGLTPAVRQPSTATRPTPVARRVSSAPRQPQPNDSPSPKPSPNAPTDASHHSQDAEDADHIPQSFAPPSKPATSPAASHTSLRPTKTTTREVEDLQTKMKLMERKRQEDRDALKKMLNVEQERDKYANLVQKMQSKMQAQSLELNDLRSQLKDSESRLIDIESIQAEHDAVVEMATLDREMAEETSESLKTELDSLRTSNEEMRLELDILKEENEELGREMNPEERTSQGWLQLERSNERLREALLRLRDITQEQEADLKAQISSLEDEVKDFGLLKNDYEETREKLLVTEADLDDIRQQLDAALGAEDMIEELTDRNMAMQEKIDDLELAIEDLESLKELNDELEINHVEAEKQMQEEIDFKANLIGEQSRRSAQQSQAIEDCEYTISRFRELVTSLQADLEDMRASRQITETESEELSSRSRAMMDLNMKLQMSAAKTQIKTIDLELRRLEAEEAAEHLAIVQLFLPDAFNAERDSVLALLRFRRVSFKSRLLSSLVKERLNGQGTKIADDDSFAAYSVLDRLTWVAEMSDRFINGIRSCSTEEFARYESALYELEPVERALNTYIDAIKRDDMREGRVDEELQRSMAVMSHLASIHIKDSLAASACDMLMQASLVQSHLDSASSAIGSCRSMVQSHIPVPRSEDNDFEESNLFTQLDSIISSIRSARVIVNKTHRNITDLQSRSLALRPSHLELLASAESLTSKLAVFGRRAGEKIQSLFGEEGREESVTLNETELLLIRLSASIFGSGSQETTPFATLNTYVSSLVTQLNELSDISANLENTQEFERPTEPWVLRSATLRATKLTSVDTEAEVTRLTEIVRERSLLVRSKEQELEEQSVRVEMLEARMAEATKRSAALADLETSITALQSEKTKHQSALAEAEQRVTRLRKERDEWRRSAEENKPDPTAKNTMATEMGGASKMELDRAKLRIDSLESAIRYLQQQSAPKSSSDLQWLEAPLITQPSKSLQRQIALQAEGKTAFSEMLKLVTEAKPVSLTDMSKNRLAWRPAAHTAKWHAQKKKEDWLTWQEWERDLLYRVEGRKVGGKINRPSKNDAVNDVGNTVVVVGENEM
jgi:dynactin 1